MGHGLRAVFYRSVDPVAACLAGWGVRPNSMTAFGLVLAAGSGLAYGFGFLFWGGGLLALSGICDALDGLVARRTGWEYKLGAFLDSTLDRVGEGVVALGLFSFFLQGRSSDSIQTGWFVAAVMSVAVFLLASLLVSYVKARAEALGAECRVGLMQRPERLVGLIVVSWLAAWPGLGVEVFIAGLALLALLTTHTVYQRMAHVCGQMGRGGN